MKSNISSKDELDKNSNLRYLSLEIFHKNKLFELVNQDYGYPVEMLIKKLYVKKIIYIRILLGLIRVVYRQGIRHMI